jgi:hypothetical protein
VARRNGSSVGAVLGIGAIAGAAFLFFRARAAWAISPAPARDQPWGGGLPSPHGAIQFPPLVERWRGEVAKRAGDLPVNALLKWIEIEGDGGDMDPKGLPNEAGIWQLFFPDDAKYGATLEGLKAIAAKSNARAAQGKNPLDISWLSPAELDMEVGAGIAKVKAARDVVRKTLAATGVSWPEWSFDFGSAVKQVHAGGTSTIAELLPKVTHAGGPPRTWGEFRQRALAFPVSQLNPGIQALANAPSRHGLKNRLEDTMANAEIIGHAWAGSAGTA